MSLNLLLITTDQQRGDCLGCDGHPVLETPYLDELAEFNERRGDPRGKNGALVPQPGGALTLSPNYYKWKERAAGTI